MSCVVCGQPIGEPHYANAWEQARKAFPCCSTTCAERFDPDLHWLPAVAPAVITGEEEVRLVKVSRERVARGDHPSVVVREMLVAGLSVMALRKIVGDASLQATATEQTVSRLNVLGMISGLLGGRWRMHESRGPDPAKLRSASEDLETWRARFG